MKKVSRIAAMWRMPSKRLDIGVLLLSLISFLGVTCATIAKSSVWFDEAFGAYLVRFSYWEVARYTAVDVHPPLYYWALKLWSSLFGYTEVAMRSMSVFFGVVAITLAFFLVRRLFGRASAYVSVVLLTISPMVVRYAQEMRMYTMVAAITIGATYVLVRAMESNRKRDWTWYAILVALGMWTHYFSALIWITHWVWRGYVVRANGGHGVFWRSFFSREWVRAHIIAGLWYAPWIPAVVFQTVVVQGAGFWIPPVTAVTLSNLLTGVVYYLDAARVKSWLALAVYVVACGLVVLSVLVSLRLKREARNNYALVLFLAVVPICILIAVSMPPLRSAFVDRYLIPTFYWLSILIAVTITLAMRWRILSIRVAIVSVLLVLGLFGYGVSNVYALGNYNKTTNTGIGTRQLLEAIWADSHGSAPIIADNPWLYYEASFYGSDAYPVYFVDARTEYKYGSLEMLKNDDYGKIKDLRQFSNNHEYVWYFGRIESGTLSLPEQSWQKMKELKRPDPVSGKQVYRAVLFKTGSNVR